MLTRGHLIGQIVDDLASIAAQAKQRARLHLFDIHIYVEDFAKEVLNRTLKINLANLNAERSNNPGLDLGDSTSGWAFQITGDKSGAKVKETLEKIDPQQGAVYSKIRILVIGEKQGTYNFTGEPYDTFGFKPAMVWDFNDICKRILSLSIDELKDLASYVSKETRRVRIELEIPDENGQFTTNIDHLIEALPKPKLSEATAMRVFLQAKHGIADADMGENIEKVALTELSKRLSKLPRWTREVFKFLVQYRDEWSSDEFFTISDPKIRRIYRGDDIDGDLMLLSEAGLLNFNEAGHEREIDFWSIHFPGSKNFQFHYSFIDYVTECGIDLRKPLVVLDFSDF